MGEKENKPFQLSFNGLLKVDFHGSRVTSDGVRRWRRSLVEGLTGKLLIRCPASVYHGVKSMLRQCGTFAANKRWNA